MEISFTYKNEPLLQKNWKLQDAGEAPLYKEQSAHPSNL